MDHNKDFHPDQSTRLLNFKAQKSQTSYKRRWALGIQMIPGNESTLRTGTANAGLRCTFKPFNSMFLLNSI